MILLFCSFVFAQKNEKAAVKRNSNNFVELCLLINFIEKLYNFDSNSLFTLSATLKI